MTEEKQVNMKVLIFFLLISFISSCSNRKELNKDQKSFNYIIGCYENWEYFDLEESIEIEVLLFNPLSNYGVKSYPNLIIGKTISNDTVAIIDKDFSKFLKKGDQIFVNPCDWSESDKYLLKPIVAIQKKDVDNHLYCSIYKIFYGCIKQIPTK